MYKVRHIYYVTENRNYKVCNMRYNIESLICKIWSIRYEVIWSIKYKVEGMIYTLYSIR